MHSKRRDSTYVLGIKEHNFIFSGYALGPKRAVKPPGNRRIFVFSQLKLYSFKASMGKGIAITGMGIISAIGNNVDENSITNLWKDYLAIFIWFTGVPALDSQQLTSFL